MCLAPVPVCSPLENQLILPMSVWSFLASTTEGTLRTLGLFIMVSEQAQLSSLLTYYVTPTEASRQFLQVHGDTTEEKHCYSQVECHWPTIPGCQRILEVERFWI